MSAKKWLILSVVSLIAAGGGAFALRAQAKGADLKQQAWKHILSRAGRVTQQMGPSVQSHSRFTVRLDPTQVLLVDNDGSEDVSDADLIVAEGKLLAGSSVVGDFELSETVTSIGGVGLTQLRFPGDGTIVIGGGSAARDGIRSRIPSRAVLGGTGRYYKTNGNAGTTTDGEDLFITLGVR